MNLTSEDTTQPVSVKKTHKILYLTKKLKKLCLRGYHKRYKTLLNFNFQNIIFNFQNIIKRPFFFRRIIV